MTVYASLDRKRFDGVCFPFYHQAVRGGLTVGSYGGCIIAYDMHSGTGPNG